MTFTIKQVPFRPAGVDPVSLKVVVREAALLINDDEFDFSFMTAGSTLPRGAIDSQHFDADVECDAAGALHVSLRVPLPFDPTEEQLNPPLLAGVKSGTVIDIAVGATEVPDEDSQANALVTSEGPQHGQD